MIPQVIEVPSPLGLRPSGLEDAPEALRRAALHQRLGSPDAVRIDVPPYDDVRDPETGILNPHGITAVARDVASAVAATLDAGRFPVLLGGDCSIVLGPLLALRRRGRYRTLTTVAKPDLKGFWVHLDVDVLDDALMPAVDYRHPGGMTWREATEILGGLLASDRACGLEITIFNPRLDPGGEIAQRLSDLITDTVPRPADDEGPDRLRHP